MKLGQKLFTDAMLLGMLLAALGIMSFVLSASYFMKQAAAQTPHAELNVSPETAKNIVYPSDTFCDSLSSINNAFPSLLRGSPNYWADCDIRRLPNKIRAGYPQSDDHAAFCQSLYLLKGKFKDRFDGLDLQQWPFTPCISLLAGS